MALHIVFEDEVEVFSKTRRNSARSWRSYDVHRVYLRIWATILLPMNYYLNSLTTTVAKKIAKNSQRGRFVEIFKRCKMS